MTSGLLVKTPTLHCSQQKIYLESQFECNEAHTQTYRDQHSKYRYWLLNNSTFLRNPLNLWTWITPMLEQL